MTTSGPNIEKILKRPATLVRAEDGTVVMGHIFKHEGRWKVLIDVDLTMNLQIPYVEPLQ